MELLPKDWIVLIVDDHYDNIIVAQTTLEYYGATVHIAQDGQAALALLQEINPTLILLDLSMPNMNGWELIKHIHQMPKLAAVPTIAVTAHAMSQDRAKVLEAGFDDYVSKPYDLRKLVAVAETAIQRKRPEGTSHG